MRAVPGTVSVGAAVAGPTRYDELTLVRDGDGWILGSPRSADFLAVPELGGSIVRWLQEGWDVGRCEARAADVAGEPVDVAGFLAELESAGLLAAPGEAPAPAVRTGPPRGRWLGRLLFGPAGVTVQCSAALLGAAVLVARPDLRPHWSDAIVTSVPLASILIMTVVGVAGGLVHEAAHYLAAARRSVPSSISMGRRLFTIVYQTDLTRLWTLPRRQRFLPLVAGMLIDAAIAGGLLVLLAGPLQDAHPLIVDVVRAVVFTRLVGIAFQAAAFMRTDLYAILAVASGCRNLWATKGAVARRLIGRATADDVTHLESVSRAEIRWGTAYLVLYVPGIVAGTWYFAAFALPALWAILLMATGAVAQHGLLSLLGAAGAVATVLAVVPTGLMLVDAGRSALRVVRRLGSG
ncbi:MAG: hypothetical protein ACFCVF_02600, partial [Kineosporiaceae bacterium]